MSMNGNNMSLIRLVVLQTCSILSAHALATYILQKYAAIDPYIGRALRKYGELIDGICCKIISYFPRHHILACVLCVRNNADIGPQFVACDYSMCTWAQSEQYALSTVVEQLGFKTILV